MRNVDPQIPLLLEEFSRLVGKKVVLDQDEAPPGDLGVVSAPQGGRRLVIRTVDGLPLAGSERSFLQQLLELIDRDSAVRNDWMALDQRLRLIERENAELANRNRWLNDFSSRDELTGLFTRTYLLAEIEAELNRALRHGSPMALLMIDIDHFKEVNDRFGHGAGDRVLQHLGSVLRQSCRVYDIPGRYGGEEFCLLLPETKLENTFGVAERIRHRFEATPIQGGEGAIRVTASVGIAALDNIPEEAVFGPSSLIERADRAVVSAKERGRNRVETWSAAMPIARLVEH
jgi:diguanylate cyclase (GGDEF)-like protein